MVKVSGVITAFVGVLIGVVLTPIIYQQSIEANVSGTTQTILLLIPVFFALAVMILGIRSMMTE